MLKSRSEVQSMSDVELLNFFFVERGSRAICEVEIMRRMLQAQVCTFAEWAISVRPIEVTPPKRKNIPDWKNKPVVPNWSKPMWQLMDQIKDSAWTRCDTTGRSRKDTMQMKPEEVNMWLDKFTQGSLCSLKWADLPNEKMKNIAKMIQEAFNRAMRANPPLLEE